MTETVYGAKHVCADCGGKFYDLGHKDAACPKCGGQPVAASLPSGGRRPVRRAPSR
ncbi:MAG: FYDLN acid domain-containing protein [Bacteroidota bacterium]|nr:FYDLN acid domain-containing protein [Kiloniellaceae bacterium]